MKKPILVIFGCAVVVFLVGLAYYFLDTQKMHVNLVVETMNGGGIFVGERGKNPLVDRPNEHQKSMQAIDEASFYESEGNRYFRSGDFGKAVEEYRKAYEVRGGFARATSGLKLALTYEKLGRYDDGIVLLDEMITKGYLSAKGVQNANEIKARLLKAKQGQPSKVP